MTLPVSLVSQPEAITDLLSVPVDLPILDILHNINIYYKNRCYRWLQTLKHIIINKNEENDIILTKLGHQN